VIALETIEFPGWPALAGQEVFKWKSLDYALTNSVEFVRKILTMMPDHPEYQWCLVDVKIQDLTAGQYPCPPKWHLDFVTTDIPGRQEINYIYQHGCGSATEFQTPGGSASVPPETICMYGRELHRSTPALVDGRRLLIRKSWTDVAKPR
jgi:hypothetical protein